MVHSYSLIQSHAFDLCAITHCTACLFSCVCAVISTGIYSSGSYWLTYTEQGRDKEIRYRYHLQKWSCFVLDFLWCFWIMRLLCCVTLRLSIKESKWKCNFAARVNKCSTSSWLSLKIRSILALTHQRWIIPLTSCLECQRTFCLTNSIKLSWLTE